MAGRRFSVEAIFKAKDQWSSKLSKMGRSVGGLNKKLRKNLKDSREFGKTWDQATAGSKRFGKRIAATSVVVGVAAGAALKNIVDEGAAFEKTMAVASAKFGDQAEVGTQAFKELEAAALSVGENTEMSADQAAGALKFMAMAGEDPTVAMNVLGDAANFATAGEVELARATDVMSDAMGPMMGKVEGADARLAAYKKTMDLMTFATTKGNQGLEEMFEATKMGAAGFRAGGQDIEQFAAATVVLSSAGIKGSKAGKDLARIMDSLTAPSKNAAALMDDIKFTPFEKKDGKMVTRDFDEMMKELGPKLEKLSDPKRARFISEVIGKNSKASALALMENSEALTKLAKEAQDAAGATATQAAKIRNTTEGMLKGMDSAMSAVKLEIFQVIKEDVKGIVKEVTEWTKANKGAISAQFRESVVWLKDNFKDIVKWGKRLGKVVAIFVAMDLAIKGVRTGLMVLQGIKWGASMIGKMGTAVNTATGAMRKFQVVNQAVERGVSSLGPKMGALAKGGALAAAAFVGWEIGKWIDDATGASSAAAGLLANITGLQDELDRMTAKANRAAATSDAEILQRKRRDLKELDQLISQGGMLDSFSGVTEERMRESTRLTGEIGELERRKTLGDMGFDPQDRGTRDAFKASVGARSALNEARYGGGDVTAEAMARLEKELADAQAHFATFKLPQNAAEVVSAVGGATPSQATDVLTDAVIEGGAAANAPFGQPPAQVPALPEKGMSREQLEQMLLQQAQMIQELQKGNTRKDKLDVTILAAPGLGVEGETDAGAVKVERTGTGV